jgi:hypothetical protein
MQLNSLQDTTDPFAAAAPEVLLDEIRNLASYLLAGDADLRQELAAEPTRQIIVQAMNTLRAAAASMCLEKLLRSHRSETARLPAIRPEATGPAATDISAWPTCDGAAAVPKICPAEPRLADGASATYVVDESAIPR